MSTLTLEERETYLWVTPYSVKATTDLQRQDWISSMLLNETSEGPNFLYPRLEA